MDGWISLHRKIWENWTWKDKPFSKGQAWIDLILMVNYEDKKVVLGNELILVKRGSRITSIRQLSDRWGWSNTKVIAFLKLLESDEMLSYKSDTKKTVITIVNYSDYQNYQNTETTEKRHENDTKTTRKHTNNNNNNNNKDNKNIYMDHVELTTNEYDQLIDKLGNETIRDEYIERLNNYIGQIGFKEAKKKYKSHYHTILNWYRKDVANGKPRSNIKQDKAENGGWGDLSHLYGK